MVGTLRAQLQHPPRKVDCMARFTRIVALAATAATVALTPASASAELPRSAAALFPYAGSDIELINHRGLSPGFPENTLAAFRNSVALGVDSIEIDMRATKDGEIVIMHDTTVDRTTDGTGAVDQLTLAEIKQLDAGGGERVPTYEEALHAVKGTGVRLLLDIKTAAVTERAVRLTEQHDMVDQVIVGPRTVANLQAFKALNPDLATLGFIATPADATPMIEAGVDYIRLWPHWILPSRDDAACQADYAARVAAFQRGDRDHPGSASCIVQQVLDQGTPVWSTVNDMPYAGMDELLGLGVTGILSDLPAELDRLIETIDAERVVSARAQTSDLVASLRQAQRTQRRGSLATILRTQLRILDAQGRVARISAQLRRGDVAEACGGLRTLSERVDGIADLGWETREVRRTLACPRA